MKLDLWAKGKDNCALKAEIYFNLSCFSEKKNAAQVPISPKSVIVLSFVPPKKD